MRKRICRNERRFKEGVERCCLDWRHAGAHMAATGRQWTKKTQTKPEPGGIGG